MTLDQLTKFSHLSDFPKFLLGKEEHKHRFKQIFQKDAPEIYADIESLSTNPNCTCSAKVKAYSSNNVAEVSKIIWNYVDGSEEFLERLVKEFEATLPVDLSGKILKTSLREWAEFYQEIKQHTFKSFSVVKEDEVVYVFFL